MAVYVPMQDPDLGVRETAGDALGQIAQGLHFQHSPLATGDPSTNPVLKAALESALEQKKEVQQAGAYALSKVCTATAMPDKHAASCSIYSWFLLVAVNLYNG